MNTEGGPGEKSRGAAGRRRQRVEGDSDQKTSDTCEMSGDPLPYIIVSANGDEGKQVTFEPVSATFK